jgi:hypothetical protein
MTEGSMHKKNGRLAAFLALTLFGAATTHAAPPSLDVAAADNAFGFRLLGAVQKTIPAATSFSRRSVRL